MFSKNHYFDNAGATPISKKVKSKMDKVQGLYHNPSGIYAGAVKVRGLIEDVRKKILSDFDANNMQAVFTSSGTTSVNLAIFGTLKKGDHFITSNIEHPAVLECVSELRSRGVETTLLPVNDDGIVDLQILRQELGPNTKLVSVMMANNEIGAIQPIKEIGRIIDEHRRKNETQFPYFHTDACQAVNYCDISMRSLRLDMLSFNGSKIYGPKGTGVLILKKGLEVNPIVFGGGQEGNLWSGTEDVSRIVGVGAAIDETLKIKDKERVRLGRLQQHFFNTIQSEVVESKINGNQESRLPNNINITLPGMDSDEMVLRLDHLGFAVSHKSACASEDTTFGSHVLGAIGQNAYASQNIRVTMGRNTKKSDVNRLIRAIKQIYYQYRRV
jgi:cysteine desulfurase